MDTPISETGIAGVAVGAALMGMRPIADVQYGDFIFCAMDQLVNQAAKVAALVVEKAFDYLDAPIRRICAPNTPVPFASIMENYYLPNAEDIINGVRQLCR